MKPQETLAECPRVSAISAASAVPLVTDLDGTIVATDTMLESMLQLLRCRPWMLLVFVGWLRGGLVRFKHRVAGARLADPRKLPWRQDVLDYLKQQRAAGRTVVLATASHLAMARRVADHLDCFDVIIGTDTGENLRGSAKVRAIRDRLQTDRFDYIGDSRWDLPVWRASVEALLVSPEPSVEREARAFGNVTRVFRMADEPGRFARAWRSVRPGGAAVVVLGLMLGRLGDLLPLTGLGTAMLCCGGAGFWAALSIGRDLLSLEQDRTRPRSQQRPLAAGHWPLLAAIRTGAALAAAGAAMIVLAMAVSW